MQLWDNLVVVLVALVQSFPACHQNYYLWMGVEEVLGVYSDGIQILLIAFCYGKIDLLCVIVFYSSSM